LSPSEWVTHFSAVLFVTMTERVVVVLRAHSTQQGLCVVA